MRQYQSAGSYSQVCVVWACPDTVACGFTFLPQTPPHRFERIDLSDLTSGLSLIPSPLAPPLTPGCSNLRLFFCLQTWTSVVSSLGRVNTGAWTRTGATSATAWTATCCCLMGAVEVSHISLFCTWCPAVSIAVSFNRSSTLCLKRKIVLPSRDNRNVCILFLQARFTPLFQNSFTKKKRTEQKM